MNPKRLACAGVALAMLLLAAIGQDQGSGAARADSPTPRSIPTPEDPLARLTAPEALAAHHLRVRGLEIDPGRAVDLEFERFEVLAPGAPVIIAGAEGEFETTPPALALFRGSITGEDGSWVYLASSVNGVRGLIRSAGRTRWLASTPGVPTRVLDADDAGVPADLNTLCAVNADIVRFMPGWPEPTAGTEPERPDPPCRIAQIAVDSDWEFTQKAGAGDATAAAEYALFLFGAVSEIYRRDLNVRLQVSYLRVWADSADPWNNTGTLYNQFSSYWNANMRAVPRHAAHMLSGRLDQLFAGEGSIASLCITDDAYAVSTKLNGAFPFPVQDQSASNWDLFVVAHELGHNFGSVHTHEYDPPIDSCGLGNCADADQGTIMSYCQLCPASGGGNGVANINLEFHPRVIETMLGYLDAAPCDLTAEGESAADDAAHAIETLPTVIDVLLNDQMQSCADVAIESYDLMSAHGARVELVPAGAFGRERLRYTPPVGAGPVDTFGYTIAGGAGATVTVQIESLRPPDPTGAIEPGVDAAYFVLTDVSTLPDYDAMTAYATEIVPRLNYPSTNAPFAGSGRSSFVGAVFEGFIEAPKPGIYTLYLASDDGSRLYLGDDLLIDNDGVHTMTEKSAPIGLRAGHHRVRVDFFERTRSAGLIVSWQGPGIAKQVIPAANWFQSVPCPGDRNLDARVDVDDLNIVLSQWGTAVPPASGGDESGDGMVTVTDLNIILSNWGDTCP